MKFETFVKTIKTIQEHLDWQDKATEFIENELCTETWAFCTVGNKLITMLEEILKEEFNDVGEWINWWLYEDVDKIVTFRDGTSKDVANLKDFYQFLLQNKAENDKTGNKKSETENQKEPNGMSFLQEILLSKKS